MKLQTFSKIVLLAAGGTMFTTVAMAQDVTLKLGVVTPTDHPHSISAREFARLVEEKTGGEVAVTVSDNGALGSNPELLDAVQTGVIDFTVSTPGVLAEYSPAMGILELPYVFQRDCQVADRGY
ncbi:MAG: TRAP transporter substrate-binding protein DctP [Sedimentitalea sp.]|uniref:TRAP transporter substrate-binding protein n=1 Tax=Sedimentitalea sp. TaxID=2048915 RepID=UPI003263ED99